MKMNFKQKNIKLAIAASMLVSSVSLSTAGYAATATDNLVVHNERCYVLHCRSGTVKFPNL